LVAAACNSPEEPEGFTVVATTTILCDIVSNIVGDDATVVVLTPVGADPHDFQPSSAQVAALTSADLVVANGLGLEQGLESILQNALDEGTDVLVLGPRIDPIPAQGDSENPDDPHFWLDPIRVVRATELIADELTRIAPNIDWQSRADTYIAQLTDTDRQITELFDSLTDAERVLVTNHDSIGYFAHQYGFVVAGTVIPAGTTLANPSSEELASLVRLMRERDLTVIFAETTQPQKLANTVAEELGSAVTVVELYTGSLGELGSGAETLIGMLTTNGDRIAEALGE